MINSITKAFGQLSDPKTRSVFWKALALTVVTYVLVWIGAWVGVDFLGNWLVNSLGGPDSGGWWIAPLDWLVQLAGFGAFLIASFFLFPAIMMGVISLMLEEVCRAVEARHYPQLGAARPQPVSEALLDALKLAATTLLLNLLLLPFFLIPPIYIVLFYLLNGHLLGREYFELTAVRRMESAEAKSLRKRYGFRILLAGVVVAIILTLPLINLFMPIVATALMVHMTEDLRSRATRV